MPVLYGGGFYAGGSAGGTGGVQGPSGVQGAQGIQGPSGISGVTGIQGPQGSQGPTGIPGPSGLQGGDGLQGAAGLAGVTGIQGPSGLLGPTGLQGPSGARGASGIPGASGAGSSTLVSMTDVVGTGLGGLGQSLFYHSGTNKYQFRYGQFPIWDIRDFGGVGDSSTDNTQAFINAGIALDTSGGTLYLPAATGEYRLYINGNPGTGGLGTPYATNTYGVMRLNRDNLTIYSDPGAEVRAITNISLIETGNIWSFIVSATNLKRFNIINGKYSFEYASTGLYTTITDEANNFIFWGGLDSYRWNFINATFSGYQIGNLNPVNNFFGKQEIVDCLFYNCNFVDWGPGETDGLIYGGGRAIFESCTFETTQARLDLAQKQSHVMYIGSDRPYVRVKNNTFKKASQTAGKYCVNLYSTNINYDYSHNQIVSNNTFIDCPRPVQTFDSTEFITIKNNKTFASTTGTQATAYDFVWDQGRGGLLFDNVADQIDILAQTHDTINYRNMTSFSPAFGFAEFTSDDSAINNLFSNNIVNKFGFSSVIFNGPPLGIMANYINIKKPVSSVLNAYSSVYCLIVNGINATYSSSVSLAWVSSLGATGSSIHNVLATVFNTSTTNNFSPRWTFTSSSSASWTMFNGVQFLNIYASGASNERPWYSAQYWRCLRKNNISLMREGDSIMSGGYNHTLIGNIHGGTIPVTGLSFYNSPSSSVYQ